MNSKFKIVFFCLLVAVFRLSAQEKDITIKIHLRGVWESKISLLALTGPDAGKPIAELPSVKNGETAILTVTKDQLPGEFVIRFDYKEKETSAPYPSEKRIFASVQDLELSVNPPYCNNADSAQFQKEEIENTVFARFSKENSEQKEKLVLLQNFLISYDDNQSAFYRTGIEEYEKKRIQYNQWLAAQTTLYKTAFVSSTFRFDFVPPMEWKGSVSDRMQSIIVHYFDGMDFKDPLILKTPGITEWMNKYVNIYGALSTTTALRDSLFPIAAKKAIDQARLGNPIVYGWMVDYFYFGFEANGIPAGITALQPYLDDPYCYTNKKQQIEKRLAGMKSMLIGSPAPDFTFKDDDGIETQFCSFPTTCRYKLVLFWSAGCDHCKELIKILYPWYQQPSNKKSVEVFALGMDDTEPDIKLWDKVHPLLEGWKHTRPTGGINSKVANAYFILSSPTMILVDTQSNKIVAIPENVEQLEAAFK
jgi:thiol-disulfide isomerase/thioredoxin